MYSSEYQENKYFNTVELQEFGAKILKFISDEYKNFEKHQVLPDCKPGDLIKKLSSSPPQKGETQDNILNEIKDKILPHTTHWQHPKFFAYFPSSMSHTTVVSDMIASAFHSPCFTWLTSPSHTELEHLVSDWIVQMLNLPQKFILKNSGGGSISNSTQESYFLSVNMAKSIKLKELNISKFDPKVFNLVGYFPEFSQGWSKKALFLKDIQYLRQFPVSYNPSIKNYSINIQEFEEQIQKDLQAGLIPFWFGATIGSTNLCGIDDLESIGKICQKYKIFMNVDAAYMGSSWICEDLRQSQKGIEYADTLLINFAKNMLVGNSGSMFYVGNKLDLMESTGGLGYIQNEIYKNKDRYVEQQSEVVDYKDWTVGFGRRFNAMKIYVLIKYFGVEGLKSHVKELIDLAIYFEKLLAEDSDQKYEIVAERQLALNCFRVKSFKGDTSLQKLNEVNKLLNQKVNKNTQYGYITGSVVGEMYFLRMVVCNHNSQKKHVDEFWNYLNQCYKEVLEEVK